MSSLRVFTSGASHVDINSFGFLPLNDERFGSPLLSHFPEKSVRAKNWKIVQYNMCFMSYCMITSKIKINVFWILFSSEAVAFKNFQKTWDFSKSFEANSSAHFSDFLAHKRRQATEVKRMILGSTIHNSPQIVVNCILEYTQLWLKRSYYKSTWDSFS